MRTSVSILVITLAGTAIAAPFVGPKNSNGTYVFPTSSGIVTPSLVPTSSPLPNPLAPSNSTFLPTPVIDSEPADFKRGDSLAIPTDLASLLSDAHSVEAALASAGGQKKRSESLSIPTNLPSLISDAESVAAALASSGAQKRGESLSIPTDLPSLLSEAQSVAAALASAGAQKPLKLRPLLDAHFGPISGFDIY
ncbi:hypothetical protein N7474_003579 [Penicillium riverlandense]|uniref:uncharacterized protein n=1 Tax=Penicillium riverlandense TaxID=1903569 RepID=UPI00254724E4|nr:uncharacterized protein N7474_003579 [Penicillium riverlandense]KAJ5826441.1 hypothetical protein N7474_003579 [Penicillium riverlandense]